MKFFQFLVAAGLFFCAITGSAQAALITVTFDGDLTDTQSYTESGLTISATAASTSLFGIVDGVWIVNCCPAPHFDQYELTTGGLFDLVELDVLHADVTDPILFEGFNSGALIETLQIVTGDGAQLTFPGFTSLDLVRITITGILTDPEFDNLQFFVEDQTLSEAPLPAALPMFVAALAGTGFVKRRRAKRVAGSAAV